MSGHVGPSLPTPVLPRLGDQYLGQFIVEKIKDNFSLTDEAFKIVSKSKPCTEDVHMCNLE